MNADHRSQPDIKSVNLEELSDYLKDIKEKSFHAQQILIWIYQRGVSSFDEMTDLSLTLREQLKKDFSFSLIVCQKVAQSQDGTRKFLFSVGHQEFIESVLIPAAKRATLCVSSQVGCRFGCRFCASGLNGFSRHLTCAEILDQIFYIQKEQTGTEITNIVFMGVGEPLDNYDAVFKAIRIINSPCGFQIAARRITVSTCGLIPQIKKMAQEGLQVELAVSLHTVDSALRTRLMPINKKYPVKELLKTCRDYAKKTKRQVTFEYVLMKGVNDSLRQAEELAKNLRGMLCKVNLIGGHSVAKTGFSSSSLSQISAFKEILTDRRIVTTVRVSRGEDVAAACGQLRYLQSLPSA